MCCLAFGLQAFAQEQVTLTFTATDLQGAYVQLNSVDIHNLSRGWTETVVFPDTVYTLTVGTGVPDNPQERGMQVMPNPFDGHTRVNVFSATSESVRMTLTDINGRHHAEYSSTLQPGDNLFDITVTMPQTYILTVQTASGIRSLKMMNTGHGGGSRIEAAETLPRAEVRLRSTSNRAFQLGDDMEYTGHATLNGRPMLSTTSIHQQYNSEEITLMFDPNASVGTLVTTDSVLVYANGVVYGYGTVISDQPVTARGFCWDTLPYPSIAGNRTDEGAGMGSFISTIAGLDNHTTYYVRAYASTAGNTVYGTEYFLSRSTNYVITDTLLIPDGQPCGLNCKVVSSIHVTGYPAESVIQSAEDIRYVRLKLEHSFAGDLWIALQCPNNTSVCILKKYNNGGVSNCTTLIPASEWGWQLSNAEHGANFGLYYWPDGTDRCDPAQNPIGECWNYCWSDNTSNGFIYACGSGLVYDNCNHISAYNPSTNVSSGKYIDTTNLTNMTNVYHPDVSFDNFTGCPLNGTWSIHILDGWSGDNGWLAEWELAFDNPGVATPAEPTVSGTPCPQAATVTDYDGNIYGTVQIGDQCWMRENLRTTRTASGAVIALSSTPNPDEGHFCMPEISYTAYGYLYNWEAAKAVCPVGWRLPTDADWTLLTDFLGGINECACDSNPTNVAKALAATEFWSSSSVPCAVGDSIAGNNLTGFTATPAGFAYGVSVEAGTSAHFWTSTPYNDNFVYYRVLHHDQSFMERNNYGDKSTGMSVRCIRNTEAAPPNQRKGAASPSAASGTD